MARVKELKADTRPMGSPTSWARTHGTYIAGKAWIDGVDTVAAEMERKWGCDRLRLLVTPDLREKFDRQRYMLNQSIWHGTLEDVRNQCERMTRAWNALDRSAEAAGAVKLASEVWEVPLHDGSVAAIVQDGADMRRVVAEGRKVVVYTLEEIARLISAYPAIAQVKEAWPGSEVTSVSKTVADPLDSIHDTSKDLNDAIDDVGRVMHAG